MKNKIIFLAETSSKDAIEHYILYVVLTLVVIVKLIILFKIDNDKDGDGK